MPLNQSQVSEPIAALIDVLRWSPDATQSAVKSVKSDPPTKLETDVRQLLAATTQAARTDPPLLRALRKQSSAFAHNVGLEMAAWNHPHANHQQSNLRVKREHAAEYAVVFESQSRGYKYKANNVVLQEAKHRPAFEHAFAVLNIAASEAGTENHAGQLTALAQGDIAFALNYYRRLAKTDVSAPLPENEFITTEDQWAAICRANVLALLRLTQEATRQYFSSEFVELQKTLEPGGGKSPIDKPSVVWDLSLVAGHLVAHLPGAGFGQHLAHQVRGCTVEVFDGKSRHLCAIDVLNQGPVIICPWPEEPHRVRLKTAYDQLTLAVQEQPANASCFGVDNGQLYFDLTIKTVTQRFVYIVPGHYWMGSPKTEAGRFNDETEPQWKEIAEGFWMADTACSQAFWIAVLGGKNPSNFKGDDLPVENISWSTIQSEFLPKFNLLSLPNSLKATLPTELEWEFACRAGSTTPFSTGETILSTQANFNGDYPYKKSDGKQENRSKIVPVKSFAANAWGLFQMHGNVWEYCHDEYGSSNYGPLPEVELVNTMGGSEKNIGAKRSVKRVVRGGSWFGHGRLLRSAYRTGFEADYAYSNVGFRLVLRGLPSGFVGFDVSQQERSEQRAPAGSGLAASDSKGNRP